MRAYIVDQSCEKGGRLVKNATRPSPLPGQTLVKLVRIGICNTDLEMLKNYEMGFTGILGHEFLGIIEEVNGANIRGLRKGQRVVGEINCHPLDGCNCRNCKLGGVAKRNHCANRSVLGIIAKDGTFCDYMVIPSENLYAVPSEISDKNAVFAEPLAAALRVVEQGAVTPDDCVAILGDGKLGLLIALVLIDKCKHLTVFGHHAANLGLLWKFPECTYPHKSISILTKVFLPLTEILKKAGVHITVLISDDSDYAAYENEFDTVIEATGSKSGFKFCGQITRPLGTVVLKSTYCGQGNHFNSTQFVVKELRVQGSRCGDIEFAVQNLLHLDLTALVTDIYEFDDIQESIDHASRKGSIKIQVTFNPHPL